MTVTGHLFQGLYLKVYDNKLLFRCYYNIYIDLSFFFSLKNK